MGKLGDLIVRLQLKHEDYKKGLKQAEKDTKGFASTLGKIKGVGLAVWGAIGGAVIAFAKEMISATNKIGDAWTHHMAGMKGAWQSTLADISNYKPDFSSLRAFFKNEWTWIKKIFGNAKDAADAAEEMSKAFDAEFELTNSLKIQRAKISGELADLQVDMRNANLSPDARKAAIARYKALLEPLYEAEIATRKNMLDAAVQAWLAGSGVTATTSEVVDFFTYYGTDPSGAAARHPELARIYETRKGDKANQPIFDAIAALAQAENGLANELKMVNRTANTIKDLPLADQIEADLDKVEFDEIEIEPINWDAVLGDYNKPLDDIVDKWRTTQEEIAQLNNALENSIVSATSNGIQALTDMIMGIEGADASQVLAALMQPFAQTMINLGEMLLAQGLAIEVFKKSFESLQGAPAIAAGLGLIALGSALTSGIKALGGSSSASASAGSYDSSSSGSGGIETYEQEITVHVVGEISGDKIVLAGQKTLNKWSR